MLLFFYKIPVRIRSESEWFPLPLSPPPTDVIAARRRVGVLVLVDGHVAELLHVVVIVVVVVVIVVALVLVRRVGNLDHWKNGIKLLRDWLAHCVLRRSISLMAHDGKSADFSILARLTMLSLIAWLPHRSVGRPTLLALRPIFG